MYWKSVVPYDQLFSSAGFIVEPNTVNKLVCLRCYLSGNILARKSLCYLVFFTEF